MSEDPNRRSSRLSTDVETIRRWAEECGAVPVRHAGAEGGTARVLIVRESDVGDPHERIEWDEFGTTIEDREQVVIYRGTDTQEPFDITGRDEAITRADLDREELETALLEGETVTSTITEQTVVESVIVEEATIESELVETDVVDQRVVDVELLDRECTACEIVGDREGDTEVLFDQGRYFDSLEIDHPYEEREESTGEATIGSEVDRESGAETAYPYRADLDVTETWTVTRELMERFTVESRIAETDVQETETVEDREIDVEGVQRDILESDLVVGDRSADEIMAEFDVRSEFTEDDTIHTFFNRRRIIEDEVVSEKRLQADVTSEEVVDMETVHSTDVETEFTNDEELTPIETAGTSPTETEAGASSTDEEATETVTDVNAKTDVRLSEDEIGKTVVDATGNEVGMVTDVDEEGNRMYIDPEPGIAERVKAVLDWGDADEEDYLIRTEQIQRVTEEDVVLKQKEDLTGTT